MTFEPCENIVSRKIDEFEVKGKTAEVWIVKGKLQIRCLGVIHNISLSLVTPQPCEDCISRQEAILQVQRYGVGCFDAEEFSPEQCERFVIQKLNDLPPVAQKEKTEWIPVSERLPEESKRYMVTTKYNDVMTDFYTGETFLQGDDIIAWMPIPESYKAESEVRNADSN